MITAITFLSALALVGVALSADRSTPKAADLVRQSYPVKAATKIYNGSMVAIELSSGYAVPASDTAGLMVVGVAQNQADNSSGANGAISVEVEEGTFDLAATSINQGMVGDYMFVVDDQTFDDVAITNFIPAGVLVKYISATRGQIRISPAIGSMYVAMQDKFASTTPGFGASLIGVQDSTGYYTHTDVEAALAELAAQISGDTSSTFNFTEANVLTDDDGVYPALEKLDLKFGDLASVANGEGASLVGVNDAGAHFSAAESDVEAALQKLAKTIVITIPRFTGWIKDGTAKTPALPLFELPVPVRIKRAYVNLGTAPDTGKTLALLVNGSAAVSVADLATQAENEALDIPIAADTNIVVTLTETASGTAANCDLMLIAQVDDGE